MVFWVWVMGLPIWVLSLGFGVAGVVVVVVGGLLVDGFVLRVWVP